MENIILKLCNFCKRYDITSNYRKGRNICKECISLKRKCKHNIRKEDCEHCKPSGTCEHNIIRKSCKICRGTICEHGIRKYRCKECKGNGICSHNKLRYECKECGGKGLCVHGKLKYRCKECGGKGLCEHGNIKNLCKECKGVSICEHGKVKYRCKECKGSNICEHGKVKYICKKCGGKSLCEHGIIRYNCKDCEGNGICEHKRLKINCVDCKGTNICEHGKRKHRCKECGGNSICNHGRDKDQCYQCNDRISCLECKNTYVDNRSYCYPYCLACFSKNNPEHKRSSLFKVKERYVVDELKNIFTDYNIKIIHDKKIEGGCSLYRPDILIDCLTHSIIIECDENQHKDYNCESKRSMQLFLDLGSIPLVLIRFNPDSYTENNNRINGCFKPLTDIKDVNKKRFYDINNNEFKRRLNILSSVVNKYLKDIPLKEVTEIKLFYDI